LVTPWRFAGRPTSFSPSSVKATIDGVVFIPSALTMTLGWPPSITATHEFVVPRSIPITFDISACSFYMAAAGRSSSAPRYVRQMRWPDVPVLELALATGI
jgi:hypothetical protein